MSKQFLHIKVITISLGVWFCFGSIHAVPDQSDPEIVVPAQARAIFAIFGVLDESYMAYMKERMRSGQLAPPRAPRRKLRVLTEKERRISAMFGVTEVPE